MILLYPFQHLHYQPVACSDSGLALGVVYVFFKIRVTDSSEKLLFISWKSCYHQMLLRTAEWCREISGGLKCWQGASWVDQGRRLHWLPSHQGIMPENYGPDVNHWLIGLLVEVSRLTNKNNLFVGHLSIWEVT